MAELSRRGNCFIENMSKTQYSNNLVRKPVILSQHAFSSFKAPLRRSKTEEKEEDRQTEDGLLRIMDEIASTEPCLKGQLGDEARLNSS